MAEPDRQERILWLRQMMSEHESALLRYAQRLLQDEARAKEVVQESFLRLWKADKAKIDGHEREWLFTVCRNRALDVRRREERMRPMDIEESERAPSPAPGPSELTERKESLGRAARAIEALPPKEREVIRLKFHDGLSYKEISRVTGHSISNVGVLIHTGMKTLRRVLSEDRRPELRPARRSS